MPTLFDGIVLALMLFSGLLAMVRGFTREVLAIASWVAAAIAAFYYYKTLAPFVAQYTASISTSPTLAEGAAAVIIFLITLIVVSLLTMRLADSIADSRIGALDRSLGFAFGAARGLLLVVVPLMFYVWLVQDTEKHPKWISESRSKPMLESIGNSIVQMLPENLLDEIKKIGEEKSETNA